MPFIHRIKPDETMWPRRGLFICREIGAWYLVVWFRLPWTEIQSFDFGTWHKVGTPAAWLRIGYDRLGGFQVHRGIAAAP